MSSALKSQTARENGAKSHGPITPEGKARSSANSRRHGLASASILMDGESAEDFQQLRADFLNQFHPQTAVETDLVDVMAIARWRLRRLLAIEAHLFDLEILERMDQIKSRSKLKAMEQEDRLAFVFQKLGDQGNSLTLLLRYEGSLNRSYDKALKQLLLLQSARPEPALGSFCNFENAEPRATIDTSLEDQAPAPPAKSVPRLQLPPVVDTLSEVNTLPVALALP
jgi:hypothetical protein